jgi:ethanolamine utilization protein EutN
MIIGTVTGDIHSTISHGFYRARPLLIVDREDATGQPTGSYVIAIDTVGAGVGQRVLVLEEGNGSRQVVRSADAPVRSVIVGIIDEVQTS